MRIPASAAPEMPFDAADMLVAIDAPPREWLLSIFPALATKPDGFGAMASLALKAMDAELLRASPG